MAAFAPLLDCLRALLLLAGLLVPGAALARALRLPATVATSFVGSAVTLYGTVLVLTMFRLPIGLGTLLVGPALITVLGFTLVRARRVAPNLIAPERESRGWFAPFVHMGAWTPLYAVFWILILVRAIHEPLAGPDVGFRWGYLAEQLLRLRSLDFYPPRHAEDFLHYFWAESLPPGTSTLLAWCYACAGAAQARWTVPVVLLQFWALHDLLWRAGWRLGGNQAARYACLAAAATPLLTWNVLLGQETGLTTIALLGIVGAWLEWRHTQTPGWGIIAALFASLGAMAREYGLVFPLLAFVGLLAARANRRTWVGFLIVALPLTLAWPVRTFLLTGNPFFSLKLAALPANPRFVAWFTEITGDFAPTLHTAAGWLGVARYLLLYAPIALAGGIALFLGALRRRPEAAFPFGAAVVVTALWYLSVPYTNGGLFYSLRVLGPTLAVGALAAGYVMVTCPNHIGRTVAVAFAAVALAMLPATLALPSHPWHTPVREWPGIAGSPQPFDPMVPLVTKETPRGLVLTDAPGFQPALAAAGIEVAPLWSPQADWLFDAHLTPAEAVRQWRESGVRYVVLTKTPPNLRFFNQHAAWLRPPFRWRRLGETDLAILYALDAAP